MEKSNKTKTTQEVLQSASQSSPSGLIYWDDYNFDNQSDTAGYLKEDFNIIYDAPAGRNSD
jgi:hypothetical protein